MAAPKVPVTKTAAEIPEDDEYSEDMEDEVAEDETLRKDFNFGNFKKPEKETPVEEEVVDDIEDEHEE